jgi:hypothetical protein
VAAVGHGRDVGGTEFPCLYVAYCTVTVKVAVCIALAEVAVTVIG